MKVLDFGLANFGGTPTTSSVDSPTISMAATQAGVILGTAAYMSPEQARGKAVDSRCDIWAFGVVLYEMLTGRRLFQGEDLTETLASVVEDQPTLDGVPRRARNVLEACLQKDPRKRLQAIGDMWLLLEDGPPAPAPRHTGIVPCVAGTAVSLAIAATIAFVHLRESPPEQRLIQLSLLPPQETGFSQFAVSPDGRRLAFVAYESSKRVTLWVRALDSLTALRLADIEPMTSPFWSPDNQFIAFFAGGKLKKMPSSGGPSQVICDAPTGRSGAWNADGVILFQSPRLPLFRVPADGGEAKPVSGQGYGLSPHFLPDRRHYLFTWASLKPGSSGIYVGALDSETAATRLLADQSNAAYARVPSGAEYLLFWRGGSLMGQRFDSGRLQLSGGPFPVAEDVAYSLFSRFASFSISENGVLVYSAANSQYDQLVWFDRTGKRLATASEAGGYDSPALSPTEKQIIVPRLEPQARTFDLWLIELERGVSRRLTSDPKDELYPVWSPDGRSIVFGSNRENLFNIYRKDVDASSKDELLLKSDHPKKSSDWSADGRFLLYTDQDSKTKYDLWVLPLSGDKTPISFLQTEFNEQDGVFSPDGKKGLRTTRTNRGSTRFTYERFRQGRSGRFPGAAVEVPDGGGTGESCSI